MKKTIMISVAAALVFTLLCGVVGGGSGFNNAVGYDSAATEEMVVDSVANGVDMKSNGTFAVSGFNKSSGEYSSEVADDSAISSETACYAYTNAKEGEATEGGANTSRVIIRNASVNAQTLDYAKFSTDLKAKIGSVDGYISDLTENKTRNDLFYATITVKVPADKLDSFLDELGKVCNVTYKEISQRDSTEEFVDIDARISAIAQERASLIELMGKTGNNVNDALQVQTRISELNRELEYYNGLMQRLQNQVNYSSVTISINEVEREETEGSGFIYEIKTGLSDALYSIVTGFEAICVFLISSIPFIAIFVILGILLVKVFKKVKAKRNQKKAVKSGAGADEIGGGEDRK